MTPSHFLQPVKGGGRSCGDRFILQVPLEVFGQTIDSFVPALAVFLQGLHRYPIQVAAHRTGQGPRIGTAQPGYGLYALAQTLQSR